MSTSLLSHLYVRPELFRNGQMVYLQNPEHESDADSRNALAHLRAQIGDGPFRVVQIQDTPSSRAAPQCLILAKPESDTPLQTEDGPLQLCGYYLKSNPQ